MAFREGYYAKVWEISPENSYVTIRISTSRKSKTTGEYEQDFSGFVRCYGDAADKARGLAPGERIKIGPASCTSRYDKEKKVTYYNFFMYDFEFGDESKNNVNAGGGENKQEESEELPF